MHIYCLAHDNTYSGYVNSNYYIVHNSYSFSNYTNYRIKLVNYLEKIKPNKTHKTQLFWVISKKELKELKEFLEPTGEITPIDSKKNFFVYNCTNYVEAINKEKSEFERNSSGEITRISKNVFIYEKVKDEFIFRDESIIKGNTTLYFSERVIEKILNSSIGGFCVFKLGKVDCDKKGLSSLEEDFMYTNYIIKK